MKAEQYLKFDNVCKKYRDIQAVNKLSFQVNKGDIYGFLGPNGAGKSTSIRMMLSLVRPSSGNIILFGNDIREDKYNSLKRIGALIEKPDFYNYLSAWKNLQILAKISGVKDKKRIDEVLEMVDLLKRSDSKVKTFSHGMKQRLGIAQALLHQPELIILDEPSNGLDPQGQHEVRKLIRKLNQDQGITIIISSHILSEIEQIANRMVIINKGSAVVEGEVNELLSSIGLNVRIKVEQLKDSIDIIYKSLWKESLIKNSGDTLHLNISREQLPEVINFLSQNNIKIYQVDARQSLEDYFILKTKNA